MNPQCAFFPAKRRIGRKRRPETTTPASPGPVLVEASFVDNLLTLAFDRAIDLSALDVAELIVLDATALVEWQGTVDVTPIGDDRVAVVMSEIGEYVGEGVKLNAVDGAGIKSDEGVAWTGVMGLELPFPS